MVDITVSHGRLRIHVRGWHRLWTLASELDFPLTHVKSIRQDPGPTLDWWHGLRLAGTWIPGVLAAGRFYDCEGGVFYDVEDPERTVVVELEDECYRRLVVDVKDPAATVVRVQQALTAQRTEAQRSA